MDFFLITYKWAVLLVLHDEKQIFWPQSQSECNIWCRAKKNLMAYMKLNVSDTKHKNVCGDNWYSSKSLMDNFRPHIETISLEISTWIIKSNQHSLLVQWLQSLAPMALVHLIFPKFQSNAIQNSDVN